MHRTPRHGGRYSIIFALWLLAWTAMGGGGVPIGAASVRPNIVLIVVDDLDVASLAFMPQTGALIRDQEMSFDHFFVTTPLCCPSCASILRGQYAHNHNVRSNFAPEGGFQTFHRQQLERSTFTTWLHTGGYRTAFIGKYLNGYPGRGLQTYVPPGWSDWFGVTRGHHKDYDVNKNGRVVHYGRRSRDYLTDVMTRRSIKFVTRATNDDVPFLLTLWPQAVHTPAISAARHADALPAAIAPRPSSFNESDVSDKPPWAAAWPALSAERIADIDQIYRDRLRMLLAVDEMVATLAQTLSDSDALDETYIFFSSDNGWLAGQHRMEGKGNPMRSRSGFRSGCVAPASRQAPRPTRWR